MDSAATAEWNGFLVLPWVRLPREARVGPFRFVPVDLSEAGGRTDCLPDGLKQRVGIFCEIEKDKCGRQRPIDRCTILALEESNSFDCWPLDLDVQAAVDALCFGCIAENKFFTWPGVPGPVTSDHFEWHSLGADGYVFATLRQGRGPGVLNFMPYDKLGITRPLHCEEKVCARWDDGFVSVLYKTLASPTERQINLIEAITLFNAAHVGSPRGVPQQAVVLIVQALEKLLEVGREQKAIATATAVCRLLEGTDLGVALFTPVLMPSRGWRVRRIVTDGGSHPPGSKEFPCPPDATVLFHWAWDLYQVRNELLHAQPSAVKHSWDTREHLVMTSFVFPLLVKALLAKEGQYHLNVSDACRIGALYALLKTSGWNEEVSGNTSAWQDVFNLMA